MSFLSALSQAIASFAAPQRDVPLLPNPERRPNFYFAPTNKPAAPGEQNWNYVGGHPPANMPQFRSPRAVPNAHPGLSLYSDDRGNRWYEDENTGERFPIPTPTGFPDQQIMPGGSVRGQFPVQHQQGRQSPLSFLI